MIDEEIKRLRDYALDLDVTERPAIGEYDVTADIRALCDAAERAIGLLRELRAGFSTNPGSIPQCQAEISAEFQRRMDLAGSFFSDH